MKTIKQFANDRGIDDRSFLRVVQGISPCASLDGMVSVGVLSKAWATWSGGSNHAPQSVQHEISTSRGKKTMSMDVDSAEFEQMVKAEWQNNESIRDEFARFSTYFAFRKANTQGKIKILFSPGVVKGDRHA